MSCSLMSAWMCVYLDLVSRAQAHSDGKRPRRFLLSCGALLRRLRSISLSSMTLLQAESKPMVPWPRSPED